MLDIGNCAQICHAALDCQLPDLKEKCLEVIKGNFETVSSRIEFVCLLSKYSTLFSDEEKKIGALKEWNQDEVGHERKSNFVYARSDLPSLQ